MQHYTLAPLVLFTALLQPFWSPPLQILISAATPSFAVYCPISTTYSPPNLLTLHNYFRFLFSVIDSLKVLPICSSSLFLHPCNRHSAQFKVGNLQQDMELRPRTRDHWDNRSLAANTTGSLS